MKTKLKHWSEYSNTFYQFAENVYAEQKHAAEKFPNGNNLLAALMEEVGELAEALLKIQESGESPENVYKEGVQVAATVYRLLALGEKTFEYTGVKCHFAGCGQPVTGDPCPMCYE